MEQYKYNETQEVQYRYEFMEAMVRTLGAQALEMLKGEITMRPKPDGSNVTNVDEALNQTLLGLTHRYFPHDLVWGEEASNSEPGDLEAAEHSWLWIADPIDGTNKLWRAYEARDFSDCNSTVLLSGFAPGATMPTMSAAYNPFRREQLLVTAGPNGAYASTSMSLDRQRLTVADGPADIEAVTRYEHPTWEEGLRPLGEVFPHAHRIKYQIRMASVALREVDVSAFPMPAHPHDVVPGAHIVHAANGSVQSLTGRFYEEIDWRVDPVDGVIVTPNTELTTAVSSRLMM
jgi:3'-phosphoadenosine 5'-phosphosulfate (PAPS) 3'-phosphatase